jgi:hypothetical protein
METAQVEDHAMKTMGVFAATVLFAALTATPIYAQQPAGPNDYAEPTGGTFSAPSRGSGGGMKGGEMPAMAMCRDLMGGMAGMPMMEPAGPMDPKQRAAMLEMRGEMMKAMGEVMMKHAHRMHGASDK